MKLPGMNSITLTLDALARLVEKELNVTQVGAKINVTEALPTNHGDAIVFTITTDCPAET